MAIATFLLKDLEKLVGKELTQEELNRIGFSLGTSLEAFDGENASIEVTPQRPDLLSVEGYARQLRGHLDIEVGAPYYESLPSEHVINVEAEMLMIRPHIRAAVIRGLSVDDFLIKSMIGLQEKIHETFGNDREKVSIGIYNSDKVEFPLFYKAVEPSSVRFEPLELAQELDLEEILALHPCGVKYGHLIRDFEKYPIFMDNQGRVLSFPPIINSNYSGKVVEGDSNLLVEVTGLHEKSVEDALCIIATALIDRGGKCYTVNSVYPGSQRKSVSLANKPATVSADYINEMAGVSMPAEEIIAHLMRMRFGAKQRNGLIHVDVPCYRVDILPQKDKAIQPDLAEDVCISYGYENLKPQLEKGYQLGKETLHARKTRHFGELCVSLGYTEVMTSVITNRQRQFDNMGKDDDPTLPIVQQPKTKSVNMIRTDILPELLYLLSRNKSESLPIKVYEIDDVIQKDDSPTGFSNNMRLCLAVMSNNESFNMAYGALDEVMARSGIDYGLREFSAPYLIKGRSAEVIVGGKTIGIMGQIHPRVLLKFGLEAPVSAIEISLDYVLGGIKQ